MTKRTGAALAFTLAAALGSVHGMRAPQGAAVAYPEGYRSWTHVKSTHVGPQSKFFANFGGMNHIYANEKAMEGYRTGKFPDGAVVVFDVLQTNETNGNQVEAARKFIDVMQKDSKRFAATGGWGFEEFKGDTQERLLTVATAQACFQCHQNGAKDHDLVFSRYRK